MKKLKKILASFTGALVTLSMSLFAFTPLVNAAPSTTMNVSPFEYVGQLGDCGLDYPAGTDGNVTSEWRAAEGNPAPALFLEKTAATTDCSSAGATIEGVEGMTVAELDFDIKDGSLCTGGSPRFNVMATDGSHFVGGCGNAASTPLGNGWSHVVFDLSNPAQAFPVVAPGATIVSIEVILDEQGSAYLDNISVNNETIGEPTVRVVIAKNIDGTMATETTASNATFPMASSWNAANLGGAGAGNYTLSSTPYGTASSAYEAGTLYMSLGANYSTNEVTGGSVVAASCTPGGAPFALAGYTTGSTMEEAQAGVPSMTAPNFTDLQNDKFVIVWNETCEAPPVTPISKEDCKNNGWMEFEGQFKNQGECVSWVLTHTLAPVTSLTTF
jgi:hypothetical protein